MSETLRDLVVSLSLNSDNFTRNIRSVNRQIQEAESKFALAGAGVSKFEATTNGLSSKLSMLQQKLTLQKNVVGQYERALTAANGKLQTAYARQQNLSTALATATQRQTKLKGEVSAASKQYRTYEKTLGASDSATIAAGQNLEALKAEYKESSQEVKKLEGQLAACTKSTQNAADAVSVANANLNNARAALKSTEAEIVRTNAALLTAQSRWTAAGTALTDFSKSAANVSKVTKSLGKNLTRYLTTPIVALGTYALKSSVDMEDAFAGVRKTIQMTEAEYADLDQAIRGMTLVKPSTYEEIAYVAETAGQLGVAESAIKAFTGVMVDLSNVATDLSAEDAATNLAKLANITGMEQTADNFERLGSTILECGINSASTEAGIVEMAMRLAAAGKQVGLSEAQIIGFATALSSVGIEAQMGGTAMSKALINMEVASVTGGEALKDFAKVSNMTAKEFKALWDSDPAAAFQAFIEGLAQMDDEGISAIATLQDIGFKEVRLRDTTLRLVNANKLLTDTQQMATKAWKENSAITDMVNERYSTSAKRLQMLQNKARLASQTLGDIMVPVLETLMDKASGVLDGLMAMDEAQRTQIVNTALMVAALGPALSLFSKLSLAASTVSKGLGKFATAVGQAGGGVKGFANVLLSSKLAVAALTAGVVAGTIALIDYASGAKAARDALEGMEATADKWRRHSAETIYANDGLAAFGLDRETFAESMLTAEQWRDRLIKTWSDGKPESKEIVSSYTESFKSLNVATRTALEELRDNATEYGHTELSEGIQKDIDALDQMDAEIERLLQKRRNKNLSEKDKLRLDELIEQREAIQIKYELVSETGYEQILEGIQDEINLARARGQSGASLDIYEKGLTATAQGYAAVTAEIDRQYVAQRALIDLMDDGEKKQEAYSALDDQYRADRLAATREYADVLKEIIFPVWEQGGIQDASADMDKLFQLFREYSTLGGDGYQNPAILEEMNALFEGMDEDELISYLGLLQQVQGLLDGGMTEGEIASIFGDDLSAGLDQLAALADFASQRSGELSGLSDILNNLIPEELQKIAVDLDMTAAEERWAAFASDPGAITTDAIIESYDDTEAETPSPSTTATISEYDDTNAAKPSPSATIAITGYDLVAYNEFAREHPVEVKGIIRLGEKHENPEDVLNDPDAQFYLNGEQIAIDIVPKEKITADTLFVYDEDGTMHVLITPEIRGTAESVAEAEAPLNTKSTFLGGVLDATTLEWLAIAEDRLRHINEEGDTWKYGWGSLVGSSLKGAVEPLENVNVEDWAAVQTFVQETIAALKNGENLDEGVVSDLETIMNLVDMLETFDLESNVTAGIGSAMEQAGWTMDADTVAANLQSVVEAAKVIGADAAAGIGEGMAGADMSAGANALAGNTESALRAPGAFDSNSPANRTKPVGQDAAAGVGAGMAEYDLSADAATLASNVERALLMSISAAKFIPIGASAMMGMAVGIRAGQGAVVSAIRSVATAAVVAAKATLQIRSPSRVFRDEVGTMMMKGLGEGVLRETEAQAKVIRNAARYITGEAQGGASASYAYDNRKTYNQQATTTVQVERLYVRDKQDVRSLAIEIAQLTKRQQAALGAR